MLPDDLLQPEAWPHPAPPSVKLIETHLSWVFVGGRQVIKIKKPVALGFVDFRSMDRRRVACEDEVRLNTRLAPGVYLGVLPIVRDTGGRLSIGGDGEIVDWAVHMRRLDDDTRADVLLGRGALTHDHINSVARAIADLHRQSAVSEASAARWASVSAIERNVLENFGQTAKLSSAYMEDRAADEIEQAQVKFVADHESLISARVRAGRIRDGHGDLRLEHIYFDSEGLRIIDCVEFDERYRVEDVCSDVAFLSMDLAGQNRVDLAEWLLARYARLSGDYDLYALVDFYEGYRAWVRAKVSALLAADAGVDEGTRMRAAREARRHFLLALACTRPPLVAPQLVCVCGVIGSGKSSIADALSRELSWPVVDSDRTRKQLLGVEETRPLTDPLWSGAYSPDVTAQVYTETFRRASVVLASKRPVIVDASFRSSATRRSARELAHAHGVPFVLLECQAPAEVCRARLSRRPPGASDGRPAMFEPFAASFEPIRELAPAEHVVVDTTETLEHTLDMLRSRLRGAS